MPIGQKLDIGEWFIMVKFFTDSGFNNEIETTPSFSGPDPLKMPPVEETETMIYVRRQKLFLTNEQIGK